ncbi:MAG: 2-dehydropantoate 2-reductase [Nitrospirota bacterium]
MRFAILGSGSVGGYYGAKLAKAGHDVTFIARGTHLQAINDKGLLIKSPLGDFCVHAHATDDTSTIATVDVVLVSVKTYDNGNALPLLLPLVGPKTMVLPLQNGVDGIDEIAALIGEKRTLGGATYITASVIEPGIIEHTGHHRRIVFGELAGGMSSRVEALAKIFFEADIQSEPKDDIRVALWEKFIYLAPFAGFTAAARLPIGPLRALSEFKSLFTLALQEVERIARAEGIQVAHTIRETIFQYVESLSSSSRSSLLNDLEKGKRLEVEALLGSVVRRGGRLGIPVPIMTTLYALLKPYENGVPQPSGV